MPALFYSGNTFAGTAVEPLSALDTLQTGVVAANTTNLPVTYQQLWNAYGDAPFSGRVVSAGIKLWYTGTALNQSGNVFAIRDPRHMSPQNFEGFAASEVQMTVLPECRIANNTRRPVVLTDGPINSDELEFHTNRATGESDHKDDEAEKSRCMYPFSRAQTGFALAALGPLVEYHSVATYPTGSPTMAMLFTGVAGQTMRFEYIVHVEYAGAYASRVGTEVTVDPKGTQAVMEATMSTQNKHSTGTDRPTSWGDMQAGLVDSLQRGAEIMLPIVNAGIQIAQNRARARQVGARLLRELR